MYNDPALKNRYFAWFLVSGFECHPEEITKQIGVSPTEVHIKGEYRIIGKKKKIKRMNKKNSWVLDSPLPKNAPIEKHLKHLLDIIKPYKQNFIDVAKKYELQFNCAVYYYEANPGICLESNIMKEISELNIPLYFDIYCMAGTVSQFEQLNADKKLTKQLSGIKLVSQLNEEEYNEAQSLANSLIEIDAARENLDIHMEDAIIWDELSEEGYTEKMSRVGEDLKKIMTAIKQSKFLTNLVKESLEKNK
ncbi:MAG: DUF4279 domain-containing protein [Patescibacteria group bacterium]